jgi:hypothetical protein
MPLTVCEHNLDLMSRIIPSLTYLHSDYLSIPNYSSKVYMKKAIHGRFHKLISKISPGKKPTPDQYEEHYKDKFNMPYDKFCAVLPGF